MTQTQWTVRQLLLWTKDFFQSKGIERPLLEAEILLSTAMKIKRIELYTSCESEPSETQRTLFRNYVKRRSAGEPTAYLVGFKEFYSLPFKVNRSVLIPRPETEDLVLNVLDTLKTYSNNEPPSVADIGTGSGAIAVALAKNHPAIQLYAVDLSNEALTVAKENAAANGVAGRIQFALSDLLDNVPPPLDIIVSNLPYVSEAEYEALPKDVKDYEPQSALLAGAKGTEIIERLIQQAAKHLKPSGHLFLEGSPMIADAVQQLLSGWRRTEILPDSFGRKRIIYAQR